MNDDLWVIAWGERAWTNVPNTGTVNGPEPVTLAHYVDVAREVGFDDWAVCEPFRSPHVLAVWIAVLGVESGVWDDMDAARDELAVTPLSTLASCLAAL